MTLNDIKLRLRALAHRRRAEDELDDELAFHLEMEARKNRAAGLAETTARRAAQAAFGGVAKVQEECRDVRGIGMLENLGRDLRYGARVLRKTPAFTAVAILSLGIGIGANTAVFSVLDNVLLRLLPVRSPEELVLLRWGGQGDVDLNFTWASGGDDGSGNWTKNVFSWPVYSAMREQSRTLHAVMGFSPLGQVNVSAHGQALATGAMVVSGNFFSALGATAYVGRALAGDNDTASGVPAAMISFRLWDRVYARDPGVIGSTLYVNGQPCVVVGVTGKDFIGVSAGGFMRTPEVDVTLPLRAKERVDASGQPRIDWFGNDWFWLQIMARRRPGRGDAEIRNELQTLVASHLPEAARGLAGGPRIFVDSGSQGLNSLRSVYHKPLYILMAIVSVTLLMACANLAGMLLARAAARKREIQLRLAVGASRFRLVRQLLAEGALLSCAGTAVGLLVAHQGVRLLLELVATGAAPIPLSVGPDARVLGFTVADRAADHGAVRFGSGLARHARGRGQRTQGRYALISRIALRRRAAAGGGAGGGGGAASGRSHPVHAKPAEPAFDPARLRCEEHGAVRYRTGPERI